MKPKITKLRTNKDVLRDLIKNDPMAEIFVMDAIMKLSDAVSESKPSDYPKNSFVYPPAWIAAGKRIKAALAKAGY